MKNKATKKATKKEVTKNQATSFGENKIAQASNSSKIIEFENCAKKGKDKGGNIVTMEHLNFYHKAKAFFSGVVLDLGKHIGIFKIHVTIKANTKLYNAKYGKDSK